MRKGAYYELGGCLGNCYPSSEMEGLSKEVRIGLSGESTVFSVALYYCYWDVRSGWVK